MRSSPSKPSMDSYMFALEVMFLGPGGSDVVQVAILGDRPPHVTRVREARVHARLRSHHLLRGRRKHGRDHVGRHERRRLGRSQRRLSSSRPRRLRLGLLSGRLARPSASDSLNCLRRRIRKFPLGRWRPRRLRRRFLRNRVLRFHLNPRNRIIIPSWRILPGR